MEKFDELKNMSAEERKELAKSKVNEAKEKFDELKNMSAEERIELAKAKADGAKAIAHHAKNTLMAKFHELKMLSLAAMLERTKVYLIQMPLKIKIITLAAAVVAVPVTKAVIFPSYTPETIAENFCEAYKDGDFEEAAKYLPPDQQKQGLAVMKNMLDNPKWLEQAPERDCSITDIHQYGYSNVQKVVTYEYSPQIILTLVDGNWTTLSIVQGPIPNSKRK